MEAPTPSLSVASAAEERVREPEGAASGTPGKNEGLLFSASASSSSPASPEIAVFVARTETPPPRPLRPRASERREDEAPATETRDREPWRPAERRSGRRRKSIADTDDDETAHRVSADAVATTLDAAAAAAHRGMEHRLTRAHTKRCAERRRARSPLFQLAQRDTEGKFPKKVFVRKKSGATTTHFFNPSSNKPLFFFFFPQALLFLLQNHNAVLLPHVLARGLDALAPALAQVRERERKKEKRGAKKSSEARWIDERRATPLKKRRREPLACGCSISSFQARLRSLFCTRESH